MKQNKEKNEWIRRSITVLLAIIIVFALRISAVYAAEKEQECTISIPVSVELKGNTENQNPEGFKCSLEPLGENTSTERMFSTVTLNGVGVATGRFDKISYTEPGDYKYKIYQIEGSRKDIIYDDSVYEVTVRVVNKETGELTAEVWAVKNQSEQKVDEIRFINYYNGITPPTTESKPQTTHHTTTNTITKSSVGTYSPKTGDYSNLFRWGAIAIVCLTCIFLLVFTGKRKKITK